MTEELTSEQITGASCPIKLVDDERGDLDLQMSPMRDLDFSELNNWLRNRLLSITYNNLPEKTADTVELRQEIIGVATRQAAGLSWYSPDGIKIFETAEGMTRLVWQCCKDNHPGLQEQTLRPYFNSIDNMMEYGRVFQLLNPELAKEPGQVAQQPSEIELPDLTEIPPKNGSKKKNSKTGRTKGRKSTGR